MRKIVFAIIAMSAATAAGAEWRYGETKDAMTDSRYARTFADGDNGAIGVKCDEPGPNSLYIHFASKEYLGGRGLGSASRELMFRFDEDAPKTSYWSYDARSAILTKNKDVWAFIERLETAKKLALRASTYDYKVVTAVIDVSDASASIAKVVEACKAVRPT